MMFGFGRHPAPVIRPLRADRAESCAHLHEQSFAHPWSAQEFAALLRDGSGLGAAALDPANGGLRGFVLSRLAGDEAEVLTIAVASAGRGKGIGGALLRENLRQVRNAGARAIFLEVAEDNASAIALYRRHGFVQVGERPGYYRRADGAKAAALVMRLTLG